MTNAARTGRVFMTRYLAMWSGVESALVMQVVVW